MKKVLYIASCIALIMTGCDPLQDIYDDIDANPTLKPVSIEITLTDDDYDLMGEESGEPGKYDNFSASISAADFIPIFLNSEYGMLDQGSSALVTYDYYQGGLDYLDYLTSATAYELTTADYDGMGTGPDQPGEYNNFAYDVLPEDYLPAFFATKYPDAEADDLVYVTYKYFDSGTSIISEYYQFDGTDWAAVEVDVPDGVTTYTLTDDDYDSMGTGDDEPGEHGNFSSSVSPDDYLPTFLLLKFPYAVSGDKKAVLYKYYSSGVQTRADEYTFDGTTWNEYSSTIQMSDPFVVGTEGWVFNPSVAFTMSSADYQMIVDYVDDNVGSEHVNSYGTGESYYGADAYYGNFSIGDSDHDGSFATWEDAIKEAIALGLLPSKYPDATTQYKGVDVMYIVSFATYNSGTRTAPTFKFQCTKSAPNPEFTFIEEL